MSMTIPASDGWQGVTQQILSALIGLQVHASPNIARGRRVRAGRKKGWNFLATWREYIKTLTNPS
jgi:hypothetical protein